MRSKEVIAKYIFKISALYKIEEPKITMRTIGNQKYREFPLLIYIHKSKENFMVKFQKVSNIKN